jgi:RimJ/RimL family protein N-acetyltransferase
MISAVRGTGPSPSYADEALRTVAPHARDDRPRDLVCHRGIERRVADHATTSEMPAPTLTDGVVHLDEFGSGDVDAHLANEDEEMARRFGWWPKRSTAHNVRAAFECWAKSWASDGPIRAFAVRDVATATLVGSCELRLEEDQIARASYSVGPHARRHGFASRALQLATQWAFDCLGIARIELYIESDNVASRGVARRCGFVEEGVLRGRFRIGNVRRDARLYARLATDRSDE